MSIVRTIGFALICFGIGTLTVLFTVYLASIAWHAGKFKAISRFAAKTQRNAGDS